jgi:23S rRNA A2030 N6-methylase RlmJ
MNYRHAFHAGNHADVLKHIVLVRVLDYLLRKDKPLAVLDAHAGIGRYDLKGAEAYKTGEWKEGIGRLLSEPLPAAVRALLATYLNIIHDLNPDGAMRFYPGSPEIIARLLRREDRIILNELHPQDADTLGPVQRRQTRARDAAGCRLSPPRQHCHSWSGVVSSCSIQPSKWRAKWTRQAGCWNTSSAACRTPLSWHGTR